MIGGGEWSAVAGSNRGRGGEPRASPDGRRATRSGMSPSLLSCGRFPPWVAMLINCVAYQDGRKLGDIAREEVSAYVERPDCFVWVALKEPDAAELEALKHQFGLHPLAV